MTLRTVTLSMRTTGSVVKSGRWRGRGVASVGPRPFGTGAVAALWCMHTTDLGDRLWASFDRAGLAQRQAFADHYRACRAGRGHLYNAHGLARPDVVVEVDKADLPGVEVLRDIDIADRDGNNLKLHVHKASR